MMHQFQPQPLPMQQQITPMPKQTHWFDQMCEVITTQQSRHEAGSLDIPPMLTLGNYIQWSSRFLRFLDLKKPHGKYLQKVSMEGPFEPPLNTVPANETVVPPRPESAAPLPETRLIAEQILYKEADEYAMSYILQSIPN